MFPASQEALQQPGPEALFLWSPIVFCKASLKIAMDSSNELDPGVAPVPLYTAI